MHRRRAHSDNADTLALEIDRFFGPDAGLINFAAEILRALEPGLDRNRQAPHAHDEIPRPYGLAAVCFHQPRVAVLVEGRGLRKQEIRASTNAIGGFRVGTERARKVERRLGQLPRIELQLTRALESFRPLPALPEKTLEHVENRGL